MLKSFTVVFSVLLLILSSCIKEESEESTFRLEVGDSLPTFSVTLNNGTTIHNETLSGKIPVIVFFHTECPDCQKELPVIQKVYQHFEQSTNVVVFAISREEAFDEVMNYWSANQLTIPFSAQPDRIIYEKFSHTGIPVVFVADQNQVIQRVWGDEQPPTESELIKEVEALQQ